MPNCQHCKSHKKGCHDWENGECGKCRRSGIPCIPYISDKRKGRPPGTRNKKRSSEANTLERKRRDADSLYGDEDDVHGDEADADLGNDDKYMEEENIQSSAQGQLQDTEVEEMGEDTRFSTLLGRHELTMAVPGGIWQRITPAGTGGKGFGGGRFIPTGGPDDHKASHAAMLNSFAEIDKRHGNFSPTKKRIKMDLDEGRDTARERNRSAGDIESYALSDDNTEEKTQLDGYADSYTLNEDDSEVVIPPLKGFPRNTKLAWSGKGGPGDLFYKIEASVNDSRQYAKLMELTQKYLKDKTITPQEYLDRAVRYIGSRATMIRELREWLGLHNREKVVGKQPFKQADERDGVQVRDFAQPAPGRALPEEAGFA